MSTVNINAVLQKVMDSPKVGAAMEQRARQIFEKRKGEVIEQFRESNITKEINIGQDAPNISATLGGYGNLFSYIGFYAEENPLLTVEKYLTNFKFRSKVPKKRSRSGTISLSFQINWFDMNIIDSLTPMPWEPGNSWVRGIERGISGFSYYMFGNFVGSRSGKAKQSKHKVGLAPTFNPQRYLPSIIKEAAAKFK